MLPQLYILSYRDKSKTYSVIFGTSERRLTGDYKQIIPVRGKDHDLYTPHMSGYLTHDVAVLELEYPANIDNFTRPVCLGTEETLQDVLSQSTPECYVSGFGLTEEYFNGKTYVFCTFSCNIDQTPILLWYQNY